MLVAILLLIIIALAIGPLILLSMVKRLKKRMDRFDQKRLRDMVQNDKVTR